MLWTEDKIQAAHIWPMIPMAFGDVALEVEDCVAMASSSSEGNEEATHAQQPGHLSLNVDRGRPVRTRTFVSVSCNIGLLDSPGGPHHAFWKIALRETLREKRRPGNQRPNQLHGVFHVAIMELYSFQALGITAKALRANSTKQIQAPSVALEVPDQIMLGQKTCQARCT